MNLFRAACLVLILVGLGALLSTTPPSELLLTPEGDQVSVFKAEPSRGTVLVVHSVFQDRQTAMPLARAMQRAGLTALSLKLNPGRPFHNYIDTLRSLCDQVHKDGPIYAVGHSMGADLVTTLAADEPRVKAVAAVGFPAETSLLECPLMVAAGAWDQVHNRSVLQAAAGESLLVISAFSDHSQETLDPFLWASIAAHFGGDDPGFRLNAPLAEGLFVLGLAGLLFSLPSPFEPRKTAIFLFLFCAALGLAHRLLAPTTHFASEANANALSTHLTELIHPVLLAAWLAVAMGNAAGDRRNPASALRLFALAAGCVALSWALNSYQHIVAQPSVLLGLPVAVLSWVPILCARAANALFYDIPGTTGLSPMFLGLVVFEVALPGRLFGWLFRGASTALAKIRKLRLETGPRPSKAHLGFLLVLLVVAGSLWQNVKKAGYILDPGDLARLGWKFFVLLILPALLFGLCVRYFETGGRQPQKNE